MEVLSHIVVEQPISMKNKLSTYSRHLAFNSPGDCKGIQLLSRQNKLYGYSLHSGFAPSTEVRFVTSSCKDFFFPSNGHIHVLIYILWRSLRTKKKPVGEYNRDQK